MARTSTKQKLGKRVKDLRKSAGLSQEKLGEIAGLDRTYISGVERAIRNPSIQTLEKIAKALKVRVADLTDF